MNANERRARLHRQIEQRRDELQRDVHEALNPASSALKLMPYIAAFSAGGYLGRRLVRRRLRQELTTRSPGSLLSLLPALIDLWLATTAMRRWLRPAARPLVHPTQES